MKKKALCVLLSVLLLLPLFACGADSKAMSDTESGSASQKNAADSEKAVILVDSAHMENNKAIRNLMEYLYGSCNVEFRVLSRDSAAERDAELSAIRAEIMAGGGPDAFILPTNEPGILLGDTADTREVLFPSVEKTMRAGVFLPLDDLIAKSQYLNLEEHNEQIMAVGRTEDGQMVLPLLYYYNIFFLDKPQMENPEIQLEDWNTLLNCTDTQVCEVLERSMITRFGQQYGQLVDYDTETLLLNPEQLAADMQGIANLTASLPGDLVPRGVVYYPLEQIVTEEYTPDTLDIMGFYKRNQLNAIPLPNTEGGVTAFITAYAAINRNSDRVEEVFRYLELLFDDGVQSGEGFRDQETGYYYGRNGVVYGSHVGAAHGGFVTSKTAYRDGLAELVQELNEKTTTARFYSEADSVLYHMWIQNNWYDAPPEDLQSAAEKACEEIEMILAE